MDQGKNRIRPVSSSNAPHRPRKKINIHAPGPTKKVCVDRIDCLFAGRVWLMWPGRPFKKAPVRDSQVGFRLQQQTLPRRESDGAPPSPTESICGRDMFGVGKIYLLRMLPSSVGKFPKFITAADFFQFFYG